MHGKHHPQSRLESQISNMNNEEHMFWRPSHSHIIRQHQRLTKSRPNTVRSDNEFTDRPRDPQIFHQQLNLISREPESTDVMTRVRYNIGSYFGP